MAVKRDMPEESKNSKVVKKEHFSIIFPDDIKVPKTEKELDEDTKNNSDSNPEK
ncbi:hypothetical protein [Listeria seeligeri]|uniref:Uncharacterized protein n=2 Tax=Listeria seeligeri TaxID=1640 RepID=A0A7X0X305_LISSE|nr:hypothetical protein [Listeria seeligeri]EFS01900.1 conserved hypothetical protein [Listeria seeligeri FSL S4-171]EFR98845.1 conserved hypothetical protein [Listeria seeligeri FSL N1-067]MBC1420336.1 hypothetical protein [Listeria seeligeri]MBC1423438.1 hypothetical protein [Listeria seeligeri]MBC1429453.1 hypothetical protein [Listeria seeligeri]